ncbi:unnamed protein product [Effrenium voratum]|uniref:ABM domain-containing protein n=1 Tax=Effrenium voratum TaxID=2562239 RepID=A0AA36JIW5_9DINO|nr:unnamed protein product [Effrenium voratum]
MEVTTAACLPQCLTNGQVVHLKGFGRGRFPGDDLCADESLVQLLLDALGPSGVMVWDGDEFAEDSFTRILDKVASAHRVSVVAFYWRSLARAFRSSWEPRAAGGRFAAKLRLVLLEEPPGMEMGSDDSWVRLGVEALRLTKASQVLCLGGGGVVAEEAAAALREKLPARWRLVPVPRLGADGSPDDEDSAVLRRMREEEWPHCELWPAAGPSGEAMEKVALVLALAARFLGFVGPLRAKDEAASAAGPNVRVLAAPATMEAERSGLMEGERFIALNRFRVREGAEDAFEQRWGKSKDEALQSLDGFRWFSLLRRVSSTPKSTGALSVVYNYDDEQYEDDYTYVSMSMWDSQKDFDAAVAASPKDAQGSTSFVNMAVNGFVTTSGPPKPAIWKGLLLEKAEVRESISQASETPLPTDCFVAMNRFTVKPGNEKEFEQRWANRESKLLEAEGFLFFQLLRREQSPDDDVNYISMSAWKDQDAFDQWWDSKSFANMAQVQGSLLEREIVRYFYEGVPEPQGTTEKS